MRGNYVKDNLVAYSPTRTLNMFRSKQKKLCWKCQKDKPQYGGNAQTLDGFGGSVHKFICQDCVEARQRSLKREE